jgi:hypothetical protein
MFDVLFPFVTYLRTLPRTTWEERFSATSLVYTHSFKTSPTYCPTIFPTYCAGSDGVTVVIILLIFWFQAAILVCSFFGLRALQITITKMFHTNQEMTFCIPRQMCNLSLRSISLMFSLQVGKKHFSSSPSLLPSNLEVVNLKFPESWC